MHALPRGADLHRPHQRSVRGLGFQSGRRTRLRPKFAADRKQDGRMQPRAAPGRRGSTGPPGAARLNGQGPESSNASRCCACAAAAIGRSGRDWRPIVSETVSRGRQAGQQAEAMAAPEVRGSRGRGRWVATAIVVVVAAGAVSAWRAGVFSPAASSGTGPGAPAPATRPVTRQDIAATTPVNATLGYAGSYPVTGPGGGTLTW